MRFIQHIGGCVCRKRCLFLFIICVAKVIRSPEIETMRFFEVTRLIKLDSGTSLSLFFLKLGFFLFNVYEVTMVTPILGGFFASLLP